MSIIILNNNHKLPRNIATSNTIMRIIKLFANVCNILSMQQSNCTANKQETLVALKLIQAETKFFTC